MKLKPLCECTDDVEVASEAHFRASAARVLKLADSDDSTELLEAMFRCQKMLIWLDRRWANGHMSTDPYTKAHGQWAKVLGKIEGKLDL